jgi:hypothetical protein
MGKSFRLPAAAELLFSCVAKRKVTKREGHPAYAPCGHPARKVCGRVAGFVDSTSCADDKLAGFRAGHPAGFSSTRPPLQRGPGRAAGHPGPHFSEVPGQEQGNRRATLRTCSCCCCCCCLSASSPSAGHDGPLLCPGPLCGGETGTTGRAAGIDRDVDAFSPGQESGRKARPRLTDLPPMDGRQAPSGVAFLFGYLSLWPRKEKATRPPQEGESSSLWTTSKAAKALPLKFPAAVQTPC